MSQKVSFLVLDYKKPVETRACLESIKKYAADIQKEVIYLDNGSCDDYVWQFKKEGLCDVLISRNSNDGCGNSMETLYRAANTKYCFMLQSDQELAMPISQKDVDYFITLIEENGYGYVDLAGMQAGSQKYSDRFGLFNREFYLSIYKGEAGLLGGCGPFNNLKYTEEYIQDYFKKNNLRVAHVTPVMVKDNGRYSIREMGDGIYKHECDTKRLYVIKYPTYKTEVYPPLNSAEWDLVLDRQWVNGTIPESWKDHSFIYWRD